MWIIVATVLLLYLLGFLFICFLNTENHGNPSSTNNNSLSASTNNDETENFCQRHHLGRYHRLFLNRLLSSNFRFDEEQAGGASQRQTSGSGGGSRQGQNSSDPSRSALFAHRQHQLRQIHHEINEMSYLLGARQTQSDQQSRSSPVPIFSRANLVQPLRNFGSSSSNYFHVCSGGANRSRYSFVHQLMSPPHTSMSATRPSVTTGESAIMSSNPGTESNNALLNNSGSTCTPGGSITYHSCGSSSLSYSPSGSESCHIFQARQRRLRDIRMQLEGLSLQLSHVDDRSAASSSMTPPQLLLHHRATTTGNSTSGSNLLMSVSPSSAGTTFGMENNLGDSSPSLIYFGRGNASMINGNSWSDDNDDDDDLPGYESIVCLLDSRQQCVDGTSSGSGVEQAEESPPPSYNDVVHLYSFEEG